MTNAGVLMEALVSQMPAAEVVVAPIQSLALTALVATRVELVDELWWAWLTVWRRPDLFVAI